MPNSLFTPHLAPMNRGILATCYGRPAAGTALSTATLLDALHAAYDAEPFVVVIDGSPSTKATLGSNAVHVTARYDERTGTVMAIAALDNLTKGASGGALQSANVALGLDETLGLPLVGLSPRDASDRRPPSRPTTVAHVLVEALPYIRRFAGKVIVVKYGGNALAGTTDHDALDVFAQRHRADAPRRPAPGRRPRRRSADQRADGPPRQDARVPRRPAGHRRRDRRHRPDGADRPGQPAAGDGHQPPRRLRRRGQRRGRRADPGRRPRPRARLRRRRRPHQPGDPRGPARRRVHPRRRHDRHRRDRPGLQHQRRRRRRRHRRGARRREARLPHRHRGPAPRTSTTPPR